MQDKEIIISAMQASIRNYDEDAAEASAQQAIDAGLNLLEAVEVGFAGMNERKTKIRIMKINEKSL